VATISVIIPAYNQGQYLAAAIQSVLSQTYQHFEIIVVDDGSTDDTRQVVDEFPDKRIRYLYQQNQGLSAARNTGIRHAMGEYLSLLDSDDLFLPTKLEVLLKRLEQDPALGMVAGQAIPFDENGLMLEKIYSIPLPEDGAQLLLSNPLHVGSVLVRRSAQEAVGYFDESLRSCEDWDMWLRMVRAGYRSGWVDHPVSLYRFHNAQMTRNSAQMTEASFAVLDKVFGDPGLVAGWKVLRNHAYGNAYLRAAAQAYHSQNFGYGKECLVQAVSLRPELMENDGEELVQRFAAWANSPKIANRVDHLESIYDNLPNNFPRLQRRRHRELGKAGIEHAFESYNRGDLIATRLATVKAFYHQPKWLMNRGVLAICLRSWLRTLVPRGT
jgi:glycosyltransferase involved in cell wall biosynthesis